VMVTVLPVSTLSPYTTLFRSFSAGLDLKQPFDGGDDMPWSQDRNQATRLAKALRYGTDFIRTLAGVAQPTIAAVNGYAIGAGNRSEEHTSELQSRFDLVCRLL